MADNADGTGGVATITLGDAGSTHTVYSQSWDGTTVGAWTSRGSRTGNGTVTVAPGDGFYWWQVIASSSGGTAASNMVWQPLTGGTSPLYERIMSAVQSRIRTLALTGVSSGNVAVRKVPYEKDVGTGLTLTYPCVQITPGPQETANPLLGVVGRDDYGYPVLVTMMEKDALKNQSTNRSRNLKWREQVIRAFQNQRLSGVDEVYTCVVEPNAIIHGGNWIEHELWTSFVYLRFTCRMTRGLT